MAGARGGRLDIMVLCREHPGVSSRTTLTLEGDDAQFLEAGLAWVTIPAFLRIAAGPRASARPPTPDASLPAARSQAP